LQLQLKMTLQYLRSIDADAIRPRRSDPARTALRDLR
jgi:hypothetical protein